jgi:hypothetical protein
MTDPSIKIELHINDRKHAIYPDLIDEELFAIGRVTAGFAYLEHALLIDSLQLLKRGQISEIPEAILGVSFDRRLKEWRELVRKYRRGSMQARQLKIATRIKALQKDRNRITHGLWSWEYATPAKVTASTFKPSFKFTESFDFEKLLKLSDAIAEVNFQLSLPRGKAQAHRSLAAARSKQGFSISRGFALQMTGQPLPLSLQRELDSVIPSKTKPWLPKK